MKTTERTKFRISVFFLFSFFSVNFIRADEVNLSARGKSDSTVKVVVEVVGTLDLNDKVDDAKNEKRATNPIPMQGLAELTYDERISQRDGKAVAHRFYREAVAKIEVAKRGYERRLRDDLRTVICELNSTKPLLYSPVGAFERNELELITVPFNSLFVDRLLPNQQAKTDFQWSHPSDVLAILFDLDAVTAGDVKSRVVAIESDLVRIEMKGSIVGSVDGIVTDLDVEAKYNFSRTAQRITWLAAKVNERRAIGSATPGFDVAARVRMVIGEPNKDQVTSPNAAEHQALKKEDAMLLEHRARGKRFSFLHDRRWHVINETPNSSILRMIDNGETIAQCNIRDMQLDPKQETTIEHFKAEILQGLKNTQPQIADAATSTNSAGLRILRVQVLGTVSESPVQWIYYHAANKQGIGVTYSFTMSADAAEKFQATDHEITNSLQIYNTTLQSSVRSAVTR